MKPIRFILLFAVLFCGIEAEAQGVLISPNAGQPHPSATLELQDTARGFLVNRMGTAQRNAIAQPAQGLLIFNTDNQCFEAYFALGWAAVACDCQAPPSTPQAPQGPTTVCSGLSASYTVSPVQGATGYTWSVPQGSSILSGQGTDSIVVSIGSNPGQVTVQANNFCGSSAAASLPISLGQPSAGFSANPSSGSPNVPVQFTASSSGWSYQWTFQNGTPASSVAQNPSVTWSGTGSFAVQLIASGNGCSDTVVQNIQIVNCSVQNQTTNYTFSNGSVSWTVPSGVCSVTIQAWGAEGANSSSSSQPGMGGYATGVLSVTPGDVLHMYVGGRNGFNGGGTGNSGGGNGGGASDVRLNGTNLSDRVIVAAGGGGAGATNGNAQGGDGGGGSCGANYCGGEGGTGANNQGPGVGGFPGGLNGGQGGFGNGGNNGGGGGGGGFNSGGQGGTNPGFGPGTNGQLGLGGNAGGATGSAGGGGGYYGGGGSSGGANSNAGGGGGSSWTGNLGNASMSAGVRSGDGQITLSY